MTGKFRVTACLFCVRSLTAITASPSATKPTTIEYPRIRSSPFTGCPKVLSHPGTPARALRVNCKGRTLSPTFDSPANVLESLLYPGTGKPNRYG